MSNQPNKEVNAPTIQEQLNNIKDQQVEMRNKATALRSEASRLEALLYAQRQAVLAL